MVSYKHLKVALVKQEVYPDLYVCPTSEKNIEKILFSSMMRVGPIGLFETFTTDFIIVKEEYDRETQLYKKVSPHAASILPMLKTKTLNELPGRDWAHPGSVYPNGHFAIDGKEINWGEYDIVISLNITIPSRIVKLFSKTLFCYMIGEANMPTEMYWTKYKYDINLNQMARGRTRSRLGVIDFPYTFVNSNTLGDILKRTLNRDSKRDGIYAEINSDTVRPVISVPSSFKFLEEVGLKVRIHKQLLSDNLIEVFDSKYFLKIGGRKIRGNSIIEAISCGSLVLMNPKDVIHNELLPPECILSKKENILKKIMLFENDENLYLLALEKQKELLSKYIFKRPLESMLKALKKKQSKNT